MGRRNNVTKERIVKELSKVRKQLADRLILLNKVSEEEILSLLRKKEQEEQKQQTEREAASHGQENEVTL